MNFSAILIITIILRGIGVGIILGIGMLTNPVRHKIGLEPYTKFIKVFYKGAGVKAYALITIIGFLLTILLFVISINQNLTAALNVFLIWSLIGSVFGFIGTAGAFPTMKKLWLTNDTDSAMLSILLNRFEIWHWFSAIGHLIGFCSLVVALAFIK